VFPSEHAVVRSSAGESVHDAIGTA
jgi:hypothetical protein